MAAEINRIAPVDAPVRPTAPPAAQAAPPTEIAPPDDRTVGSGRASNLRLGSAWEDVGGVGDYHSIFGHQGYVKDGSDPQLLPLLTQLLAQAPELQGTQVAANVAAGRVTPEDVQSVQRFLESKGYSVGDTGVDGKYGPRTHGALQGFLNGGPRTAAAAGASQPSATNPGPARDPRVEVRPVDAEPQRQQDTQNRTGMRTGAPEGYRPIHGQVPPGVTAKARSLLSLPMGSEVPFELDGKRYFARLEPHYHPPGYVGGPTGWHKGVSVYQGA